MSISQPPTHSSPSPGLSELIKGFVATVLGTLQTRLELVVNELETERERMEGFLLMAVGFIFCLCMGFVVLSFLIAIIFWDTAARLPVIGIMAGVYFLIAIVLGCCLKNKIKDKPHLFAHTISELAKDRDHIRGSLSSKK